MAPRAAAGTITAGVISTLALRARALSPGGALAATAIGGALVAGAGWRSGIALVTFFTSSTLLGRLPAPGTLEQRRGDQRDAVQVLANGGVAATLAILAGIAPRRLRPPLVAGARGAIAAAAADTWATEIGSRLGHRPRSIVSGQRVPPGTSGGVTLAGLAGSVAGSAALEAMASVPPAGVRQRLLPPSLPVALAGVTGSLVDSVLGATIQEVRYCPICARETELPVHRCGTSTTPIRGASWCDNDAVNALATAAGAATAMLLTASLSRGSRRRGPDGASSRRLV